MVRVGVIGLGHVAHHQIRALEAVEGAELAALCDIDESKRGLAPADAPFFADIEGFLRAAPDVVVVSTPPAVHAEIARAALTAGCDVLIEKPIAADIATIDALIVLAAKLGRQCFSALHAAFGRDVLWFCQARREGVGADWGALTELECRFYDPYVGENGQVIAAAQGLQSAWLDSAVNALSVVGCFIDPNCLQIKGVDIPSSLRGRATYAFAGARGMCGEVAVDTNWALGRNAKSSALRFESGVEILLDHSAESVVRVDGATSATLAALADETPRLTAHYIGVFRDLVARRMERRSNMAHSRALHALMLEAWRSRS